MKLKTPILSNENLTITCPLTGITSTINVPALPGHLLEWSSPFGSFKTARSIVDEGSSYLSRLTPEILAGLVLTIYDHYGLIAARKSSALQMNQMLQSASTSHLIALLQVSQSFSSAKCENLPALSFDLSAYERCSTFAACIYSYTQSIQAILLEGRGRRPANTAFKGALKNLGGGYQKILKPTLSDVEEEFEDSFKIQKARFKELIKLAEFSDKLSEMLTHLSKGRNLIALDSKMRERLIRRLADLGQHELANIIENTHNPYDIFNSVDTELERFSDILESPIRRMSIKEILQQKKLRSENSNEL